MRAIKNTFKGIGEVSGVTFNLIERKGLHSIWERSDGYYEVITLTEQQAGTMKIGGKTINLEAKEIYPKGESWGTKGNGKCVAQVVRAKNLFQQRI